VKRLIQAVRNRVTWTPTDPQYKLADAFRFYGQQGVPVEIKIGTWLQVTAIRGEEIEVDIDD
jgi:hypothetical protein